ncbi:MAG TPA: ferritin [Anaeromyxobacteraceae bacterium]|nr:ferritin [Anaeromyxobacteraceae bacterium]
MMTPKIQEALCAHVEQEVYSAYLYLAMGAYCEAKGFKGFGHWLRVQHGEELEHARKVLDYVTARGGQASLGAIEAPPREFGSIPQVFEAVLAHERRVTERVHALYAAAGAEKDTATQVFLQWFVTEQVEEECAVVEILSKLSMVGDRPGTILYLDKEYGKRGRTG